MQVRTRWIRTITPDAPPVDPDDPDDPGSTRLVDENFDGGQDGESIDVGGITSDSIGGTLGATLSHSSTWQLEGGYSLHLDGTAAEWARWEHASHDDHFATWYYYHAALPGETAYVYYLYAANGTTVALRVGVTAAGLVYLQDSTTGTGAADDLSPALTIGQYYRMDLTAGHGSATLSIFDTATINETGTTDDWDTLSITLTATAFSDEVVGLINTLASGGTEVTGNLINEDFEGAANTVAATSSTTTADTSAGSGVLTHSTTYAAEGTRSLRVNGTSSSMLRWDKVSRSNTYISLYLRFITAPVGATSYFGQVRVGSDATAACQFGITTAGKLFIRNANTGGGGAEDTQTTTLTTATTYRVDISALGAGDLTLRVYTGANVDSTNTANALETMSCTLAATDFADIQIGQVSSVTTAPNYFIDRLKADNTALPTPIGVTAGGTPLGGYIERFKSDSAIMPTPLTIVAPPTVDGQLVPESGAWFGSSTPATGGSGTSELGLSQYLTATGDRRPHILHMFIATWNGTFNAAQHRMLTPATGNRAIPFVNWKPGANVATVASGGANSVLDTAFDNMTAYPHKMLVTVWHEYDNNFGGSSATAQQAADYVNMFRYVVQRYRQRVAQADRNVVWVWVPTGYSSFGATASGDYNLLYPGDDVVDWIGWDPYGHEPDDNFSEVVNETDTSTNGWTGFYNWATTPRTLPASGSRPTNFSGAKPNMMAETGVDLWSASNGKTDANAAAFVNTIPLQAPDYPQLKAIVYWNGLTGNGDYQIQRSGYTQTRAAFINMLDDAYFTQDTASAD